MGDALIFLFGLVVGGPLGFVVCCMFRVGGEG